MEGLVRRSMIRRWEVFEQRTPEWFDAREKCFVTASKVATMMGMGRFQSRKKWSENKIRDIKEEPSEYTKQIMQHGVDNEIVAFNHFKSWLSRKHPDWSVLEVGMTAEYWNILVDDDYILRLLIGASPDGLIRDGGGTNYGVVEIKCPYKGEVYHCLSEHGMIPIQHLIQLVIQMFTMHVHVGYYICLTKTQLYIVKIDSRDSEVMKIIFLIQERAMEWLKIYTNFIQDGHENYNFFSLHRNEKRYMEMKLNNMQRQLAKKNYKYYILNRCENKKGYTVS